MFKFRALGLWVCIHVASCTLYPQYMPQYSMYIHVYIYNIHTYTYYTQYDIIWYRIGYGWWSKCCLMYAVLLNVGATRARDSDRSKWIKHDTPWYAHRSYALNVDPMHPGFFFRVDMELLKVPQFNNHERWWNKKQNNMQIWMSITHALGSNGSYLESEGCSGDGLNQTWQSSSWFLGFQVWVP